MTDVLERLRAADPARALGALLTDAQLRTWREAGLGKVLSGARQPVDVPATRDGAPLTAAALLPGQRRAVRPSERPDAATRSVAATTAPRRRSRTAVRRLLTSAAGVAAAVALAVTVGLPGRTDPAVAATPTLLQYAQIASTSKNEAQSLARACLERQRAQREAPASFTVRWTEWSLNTRVDGRVVTSAVVPVQVALSRRSDGSAELVRRTSVPQFPNRQSRERWEDEGRPAAQPRMVGAQRWSPGELRQASAGLPDDPDRLLQVLARSHPIDELGDAEVLVAIADTYRAAELSPAQQAAMFALAVSRPGLQPYGRVTDRAGRNGFALSVESDHSGLPTRYTAIFDPVTGRLLDLEQTLTTTAGRLNVPVPSTIAYTVFE